MRSFSGLGFRKFPSRYSLRLSKFPKCKSGKRARVLGFQLLKDAWTSRRPLILRFETLRCSRTDSERQSAVKRRGIVAPSAVRSTSDNSGPRVGSPCAQKEKRHEERGQEASRASHPRPLRHVHEGLLEDACRGLVRESLR